VDRIKLGMGWARGGRIAATLALVVVLALAAIAPQAAQAARTPLPPAAAAAALSAAEWSQLLELTRGSIAAGDLFGYALAISGDTIVVGAPSYDDGGTADVGAAFVFVRSGDTWVQEGSPLTMGIVGSYFGGAVAISGDTIVVGAPQRDGSSGGAYVFVRGGGTWAQQGPAGGKSTDFIGAGAPGSQWGYSVAISGDTIVVGVPGRNGGTGAACVLVRSGDEWSFQGPTGGASTDPIGTGGAPGDQFGRSVAISGDTVVVSAPYQTVSGEPNAGAAYVFVRQGTEWAPQGPASGASHPIGTGSDAKEYFGLNVGISGDTIVVGAPYKDAEMGAAYVFVREGTTWSPQGPKVGTGTGPIGFGADPGDLFGNSVAISGDTIVVGASHQRVSGKAGAGAAYVFVRQGTEWSPQGPAGTSNRIGSGAAGDYLGSAVAISGNTIAVAAVHHAVGASTNAGTAYVFQRTLPSVAPAAPAPLCERADVAAVIYGAWEGTPVRAWVGGGEQPTLHTAHDAFGRQAVLWTFYPPQSTDWTVRVQPQLPAGLQAPRWQYKLVWIEPAPPGFVSGQAAGGAVTISRCSGTVLHFQLVDTGAQ